MKKDLFYRNEIEQTKKDISRIKEFLAVKHYDHSLKTTKKQLEKKYDAEMKETLSHLYEGREKKRSEIIGNKSTMLFRRKKAVLSFIPTVVDKFREKYSALSIEDLFIELNTYPIVETYEYIDAEQYITLAASIWIADHLQTNKKLTEIIPFLLDCVDFDANYLQGGLFDAVHSDKYLYGIHYIVTHRNDTEQKTNSINNLTNDAAVSRSLKEQSYSCFSGPTKPSIRECFDSIISLIHPADIEQATKQFENKQLELLDLFYECRLISQEKTNSLNEKWLHLQEKRVQILENRLESDIYPWLDMDLKQKSEIDKLSEKCARQFRQVNSIVPTLLNTLSCNDTDREQYFEKNEDLDDYTVCRAKEYTVEDPFEIAFALLYLIDSGSDLPWIISLGTGVLGAACIQLPWAKQNIIRNANANTEEELPYSKEADDSLDEAETNSSTKEPSKPISKVILNKSFFSPRLNDSFLWNDSGIAKPQKSFKMNYAQLVYEIGLGLVPRYQLVDEKDLSDAVLKKAGLSVTEIEYFHCYKDYILASIIKEENENELSIHLEKKLFEENEKRNEESENQTIGSIDEQLKEIKKDYQKLKALYKEEHIEYNRLSRKVKILEEENDELLECNEDLQKYLDQLKTNDNVLAPVPNDPLHFPYRATNKIVIYGGHEKWKNRIKHYIHGVRIDVLTNIHDSRLIANADIIFLQTRVLGHSDFYAIMDIAKKNNVPVEYFNFASPYKCARQLAEYDMQHKKDQ